MKSKKILLSTAAITTAMAIGMSSVFAFSDTTDHWANSSIDKWTDNEVVAGYPNGNFGPNDTMTRGQFAVILDHLMKYPEKGANNFTDLTDGQWYADAMLKLTSYGVMAGNGDGTVGPNNNITREQAATLVCKMLKVAPSDGETTFKDNDKISDWAMGYVATVQELGFMNGDNKGNFNPTATLTRAEGIAIINNMVQEYIYKPGVYDLKDKTGMVLVNTTGVTIKNGKDIAVIATEGINEGKLTITDSEVLAVLAFGAKNIEVTGTSQVGTVLVDNKKGVEITTKDTASIFQVYSNTDGTTVNGSEINKGEDNVKDATATIRENGVNAQCKEDGKFGNAANFDYNAAYKAAGIKMSKDKDGVVNITVPKVHTAAMREAYSALFGDIEAGATQNVAYMGLSFGKVENAVSVKVGSTIEGVNAAKPMAADSFNGNHINYFGIAKYVDGEWQNINKDQTTKYIQWLDKDGKLLETQKFVYTIAEEESTFVLGTAVVRPDGLNATYTGSDEGFGTVANFKYSEAFKAAGIEIATAVDKNGVLNVTLPKTFTAENAIALNSVKNAREQAYLGMVVGNQPTNAKSFKFAGSLEGLKDAETISLLTDGSLVHEGKFLGYIPVAQLSEGTWTPMVGLDETFVSWLDADGKVISTEYIQINIATR